MIHWMLLKLKSNPERMQSAEANKYGTLIAKLLRDKITDAEAQELDEWILSREENMQLFEMLINEYKTKWAKEWFKKAGISTRGIKWKNMEGWYKPEDKNLWDFYILMAFMFLFLVFVYFVLEYDL